jgi:hypothetical protein
MTINEQRLSDLIEQAIALIELIAKVESSAKKDWTEETPIAKSVRTYCGHMLHAAKVNDLGGCSLCQR